MISDAEVFPIQEINYLRSFTSGEPQRLVDNYRKRQQQNPSALLKDLWAELERRFGSPAVITNALLERMHKTASFGENENTKLQEFADLCADVESQVAHLPGLQCLNFPNAVQPIAEKLPSGTTIQALNGTSLDLPTLIECDSIPRVKREVLTPEMARRFPHLKEIAGEIPPFNDDADIHLLIGRDAPELLKVRDFINGPNGAPWAQRLSLGWTITGQMCLDLASRPAHALARRTNLLLANQIATLQSWPNQ